MDDGGRGAVVAAIAVADGAGRAHRSVRGAGGGAGRERPRQRHVDVEVARHVHGSDDLLRAGAVLDLDGDAGEPLAAGDRVVNRAGRVELRTGDAVVAGGHARLAL